ncbi:TonB-dependent receptor [Pseudoalteromonas tunicata]|uniref:TonB-dependent receptor n=1 Tax=Pseudoalteromonas tunicata TaxID=314281 RepID=UPI00274029D6|nr:TonB-dependent receptor [Pseudoalteromonas tunicata]MDP5212315.1 TonB-dependent receptor [Pseudoalteromonas tunicata]
MKLNNLTLALRVAFFIPLGLVSHISAANQQDAATQEPAKQDIEKIMVTGQKITRSLQETTSSVAVLTSEVIEQQQIDTFTDVLVRTANTHADDYGFSIRGIDGFNVSGGGNSYLASVYIDGAPLPASLIRNGGFSTWDAKQIEILRGPQSTLQGRNALAGAVILNTQDASFYNEGKYRLTLGSNGQQEAALAIGGGLIDETLAFRFSGEEKRYDGTITNTFDNSDSDADDSHTYRLKLLYTPENIDGFSAQLSVMNAKRVYGDANLTIDGGTDPFANRVTQYNDPRSRQVSTDLISLGLNYDLNEAVSFSSYTTYSDVVEAFDWDSDYPQGFGSTPITDTGSATLYNNQEDTLTQEFRFNFEYEQFSAVAGAYYFKGDSTALSTGLNNYVLARLGLSSSALQAQYQLSPHIADLVISQYDAFNPAKTEIFSLSTSEVTSYALFADGVWHINDQWDILAGIRFDREKQQNAADAKYTILNQDKMPQASHYIGTPYAAIAPLISGINSLLLGMADKASQTAPLSDASFNTVLPKIGATYHFNDDLITTFTYQKGYRSGGVGVNQARSEVFEYDPEYTDNYELSIRSTWLDGKLTANANVFYLDWKDQQVSVQLSPNNFDLQTFNAGQSTVKGMELELNYVINHNLKTYLALGHSGTEFTDFKVVTPTSNNGQTEFDLSGRQFPAPENTHSLGLTYQSDEGFFTDINVNYASAAPDRTNPYRDGLEPTHPYFDLHNNARTLVNAQLGYEWESFGVYLVGSNLLDEEYFVSNRVRNPRLGKPREFALTVRGVFDW